MWVELGCDVDSRDLLADAAREGMLFAPGSQFFADRGPSRGLRLTLAQANERKLKLQITQLTNDLAVAMVDVRRLEAENAQRVVNTSHLTAAVGQYADIMQSQRQEVDKYRTLSAKAERRGVELADRINDLESQLASLTRQVRQLREDAQERNTRLAKLNEAWKKVPQATRLAIVGEGAAVPHQRHRLPLDPIDTTHTVAGQAAILACP